jgi:pilus assembly protein CpaB
MRNVRVLATDQRTDNKVGDDGKTVVSTFSTVTVETTPKMAEEIAVAQTVGTLSLSLRSIADNAGELEDAIASGSVSVPAGSDPKAERAMLLRLASQPSSGASSYVTGADVSRYQRSTVPGKAVASGGPGGSAQMMMPAGVPGGAPAGAPSGAIASGPVVRVARGNSMTIVPVGGK